MTNLTYTAHLTRQIIKYGAIGIISLLILRFFWGITTTYLRQKYPPPPPPPTVPFGRLPTLYFPEKENLPDLTFKLETINGQLPTLQTTERVYFISQPTANLLALDRAKILANKMGFKDEPEKITDKVFRFTGQKTGNVLEMDIITQKFKLTYDFLNDQTIFSEKKLPHDEQAIIEAKNFLSQASLLTPSLEKGKADVSYLKYEAPNLIPALSSSEADFVRVDMFPQELDELKIITPNPKQSLTSLLFSGSRELNKRIVEVNYFPLLISQENSGTYPLKNPASAWEELAGGNGYIASIDDSNNGNITIRRIYIAYYQANVQQNFLQPIFVFEGDPNFIAYIQAVDSNWNE